MFVLGNVPLNQYCIGDFVDVYTRVPTPQAALQQSQRLLQVSSVILWLKLLSGFIIRVCLHKPESLIETLLLTALPCMHTKCIKHCL